MLWPTPLAAPRLTFLKKVELSYIRSLSKATWLKKVTPSKGSFFDLFDLDSLRSRTIALKYTPDSGNYPAYNNHNSLPGTLYSLRSFK